MNMDWTAVHARLAKTEAAIERESGYSPDEAKAILKARAAALAQPPASGHITGDSTGILEFSLGPERYGIELTSIQELWPLKALTPLPGMPPFVLGIISVRGQVFSVIDLKKIFDVPDKGLTDHNKAILLKDNDIGFGIVADSIVGVRHIATMDVQKSLPTLAGKRQEYIKGITPEQLILLDAQKLTSDKNLKPTI